MKKFAMLVLVSMFVVASFTACKKQEAPAPAPGGTEQKGTMETTTPAEPAPAAPAPAQSAK